MSQLNLTKNARLKVTKGNLTKGTIGVVVPNHEEEFDFLIDGKSKPDFLFFLTANASIAFGVFEYEIEIFE